MGKGAPDWSNVRKGVSVFRLDDMAELAARLGSIVTFDRRGDVLLLDSFEGGINKCTTGGTPSYSEATLAVATARNGGYSCYLRTTGGVGSTADLSYFIFYPTLCRFGFEYSFARGTTFNLLTIIINLFDGADLLELRIRYTATTKTWAYYDQNGAWQDLSPTYEAGGGSWLYHTLKLVFDGVTEKYVRLIIDKNTYLLTDIPARKTASATWPYLQCKIEAASVGTDVTQVYVEDVIMTQNEP